MILLHASRISSKNSLSPLRDIHHTFLDILILLTPSLVIRSTLLPNIFFRYSVRFKKFSRVAFSFSNSTIMSISLSFLCYPFTYEPKIPIPLTLNLLIFSIFSFIFLSMSSKVSVSATI